MATEILIKFDTIEMMLYFWDSISQREKIAESFIIILSEHHDMKYLYDENFNKESVRKTLSAISNREVVNHPTKKEGRFWNNIMWMLEDIGFMNKMVAPIKTLNLDSLKFILPGEKYEVIFVPGHMDEFYIEGNKLIINFFKIVVDMYEEDKVTISCEPLKQYIEEKLLSMEII